MFHNFFLRKLFDIFYPDLYNRKGTYALRDYIAHPNMLARSAKLIETSEDGLHVFQTIVEPELRSFLNYLVSNKPLENQGAAKQIFNFASHLWSREVGNRHGSAIEDAKPFIHEAVLSLLAVKLPFESEELIEHFVQSPLESKFKPAIKLGCFLGKCFWEDEIIQQIADHTNKSLFLVDYVLSLEEYNRPTEQGRDYRDVLTKLADDPTVRKFLLEVGVSAKTASQHSVVAAEVYVPLLQYPDSHPTLIPILEKCPAILPSLVEKLNDNDIYTQLVRENQGDAIPHLLMALKNPLIQTKASQLLIEFGTSAVKPSIDFAEQHSEERTIVCEILSAIGEPALHAVLSRIERTNSARRDALLQLLVLDDALVSSLNRALSDSKLQVGALICLGQIQGEGSDTAILSFHDSDATKGSLIAELVVTREGTLLSQFCSVGGLLDIESACSDSDVLKQFLHRCTRNSSFCKDYDDFVWQQSMRYLSLCSESQMEGEMEAEIQSWLRQRIQQSANTAYDQQLIELYGNAPTPFLEEMTMQMGTRCLPYLHLLLSSESAAQHAQLLLQKLEIPKSKKKAYLELHLTDANTVVSKNAFSVLVAMKLGDVAIFRQVLERARDNQQRILAIKGIENLKQCNGELLEILIAIALDSGNDHLSIAAAKCVIASRQKAPHHRKAIERQVKFLSPRSERTRRLRDLGRSLS